jgi:septal ring factor EnvC (AmiA/AmiB activator)
LAQPVSANSNRRSPYPHTVWACAFIILAIALNTPAAGRRREPPAQQQMQAAEHVRATEAAAQHEAAQRAATAAAEADRLAQERILAAARLRQAEAATEAAAERMDGLQRQRREAAAKLSARAESMQPLLPVIERLSLYPAETLLAVPAPPEETLRGVVVLEGLAQELQQEAAALRQDQLALDAARAAIAAEAPRLAAAQTAQRTQEAALDQQIAATQARRQQAEADAEAAAARVAEAASRAETLRAMLAALAAQRQAEAERAREAAARALREKRSAAAQSAREREAALARPNGPDALATTDVPKGQLVVPVAGTAFRRWGDPTDAGPASGISYHTAPTARVVSPCGGRVAFAAPFRSFGLLLIEDCGGGYHVVLAGFERLDVKVGQRVRPGEPVGIMPGWQPGSASPPALYVELRHGGQPVNPAPWLKTSR